MGNAQEKVCTRCERVLPLTAYTSHAHGKQGKRPDCRECRAAYFQSRYELTKERSLESARVWRHKNADRLRPVYRDRTAKWRKNNPDKWRELYMKREAQRRGAKGFASAEQIRARIEMYGNRCWMCGMEAEAMDHVIPVSKGGSHWPSNLRPACTSCNSRKHARLVHRIA